MGPAVELDSPSPQSAVLPDLVLLNPVAGGGIANGAARRIQRFAAEIGWRVDFRVTKSADDLAAQARAGQAAGYTRILALGGDGHFSNLPTQLASAKTSCWAFFPQVAAMTWHGRWDFLGIPSLQQDSCSTARFVFWTLPGCGLPTETSGSTWVAEESASTHWPRNLPKECTAIFEGALVTCCP